MTLTADFVTGIPLTFARNRRLLADTPGLQEGVLDPGDLKVSQRAAGGVNMSVDVAIGGGWIKIDTGTRNGLAHVYNDALANVGVGAAHATLPRLDLIVLQYNDTGIPTGVGGNVPTLRVIAGVATAGATLDNRSGATALPADALLIADVLVPAASSTVTNANIRDRRPWAWGAFTQKVQSTGGAISVTSTTFSIVGNLANLTHRVEIARPVLITAEATVLSANAGNISFTPFLNGVDPAVGDLGGGTGAAATGGFIGQRLGWTLSLAPGSYLVGLAAKINLGAGASILVAPGFTNTLRFGVQEIVRAFADNT